MQIVDFEAHNADVQRVWAAYRAGNPVRVPIVWEINPRFTMWMPEANPRGITFEQYFHDPQLMVERQIEHAYWVRHHMPQDAEMGMPKHGWDVQRHLVFLRDQLNVRSIDTGFPIELGKARRDLGPEVELLGGPAVPLLHHGTPEQVRHETIRILHSGVMEVREGNNLAPGTPLENLWTMYETGKEYGRYV